MASPSISIGSYLLTAILAGLEPTFGLLVGSGRLSFTRNLVQLEGRLQAWELELSIHKLFGHELLPAAVEMLI